MKDFKQFFYDSYFNPRWGTSYTDRETATVILCFEWDFTSELFTEIWVDRAFVDDKLDKTNTDPKLLNQFGQETAKMLNLTWDKLMEEDGFCADFIVRYDKQSYYDNDTNQTEISYSNFDIDVKGRNKDIWLSKDIEAWLIGILEEVIEQWSSY